MSVLNLTFSYVRPYIYQASGALEDLNFRKKKNLLKNLAIIFIVLTAFYVYLTGTIVAKNLQRENLVNLLNKTEFENAEAESIFINEGYGKGMAYFIGYEEPKNIRVIKKAGNVAVKNVEKQNFY